MYSLNNIILSYFKLHNSEHSSNIIFPSILKVLLPFLSFQTISRSKTRKCFVLFQRLTIAVEGMTCASCVGTVNNAIKNTDGVVDCSVNLIAKKAVVFFGAPADAEDIVDTVDMVG
jgi:copper chaperone CopZ